MGLRVAPVVVAGGAIVGERWKNYVRRASRPFETAIVEVIDPNTTLTTPYDPETGLGGDSVVSVVWPVIEGYGDQAYGEGPYGGLYSEGANAWVEVIGSSGQRNAGPQPTDMTAVRVHIDLETFGTTEFIRSGFQVRVLGGGRDRVLERRIITIDKVTTGNLAVQRTLECSIDEKAYLD